MEKIVLPLWSLKQRNGAFSWKPADKTDLSEVNVNVLEQNGQQTPGDHKDGLYDCSNQPAQPSRIIACNRKKRLFFLTQKQA